MIRRNLLRRWSLVGFGSLAPAPAVLAGYGNAWGQNFGAPLFLLATFMGAYNGW